MRPTPPATELVIARFNEPLDWLLHFPDLAKTIYNKGQPIGALPFAATRCPLPNVGREAHTYLHHIQTHYDALAEVTVLLQANPFDHVPDLIDRLPDAVAWVRRTGRAISLSQYYLKPKDGLDPSDQVVMMGGRPVRYGHWDRIAQRKAPRHNRGWVDRIWDAYFQGPRPTPWWLAYGACWVVPRDVLRARPRAYWAALADKTTRSRASRDVRSAWSLELAWYYLLDPSYAIRWPLP